MESKAESETEEGEKASEGENERNVEKEPESEGAVEPKTGNKCQLLQHLPQGAWDSPQTQLGMFPGTLGCPVLEQIPLEPPCTAQAPNPALSFPALGVGETIAAPKCLWVIEMEGGSPIFHKIGSFWMQ